MSGLIDIRHIQVPLQAVEVAQAFLREAGRSGAEGFALWVGRVEGEAFFVTEAVIPAQRALRLSTGICVQVDADELHRLNVWLFRHGLTLAAQLHSHPGDAYHSDTDDTFPIAAAVGSLSLVVPNFARDPFALSDCAVYRLSRSEGWTYLPPDEADRLITIVP